MFEDGDELISDVINIAPSADNSYTVLFFSSAYF